jgi:hypothetical protein
MTNNKQQTAMKLYTEEQLLNTADAIRNYLKNYPEKFHESIIEKHLKNLTPIELPSDEEIKKYTPYPLGKGFYNPLYSNKWEEGAKWMRNKIQGGEQ